MPLAMTPLQFARNYSEMFVYLFPPELSDADKKKPGYEAKEGWQLVSATNYRLSYSEWDSPFWQDVAKGAAAAKSISVRVRGIS